MLGPATRLGGSLPRSPKVATTRPAASAGGQIGYRWQTGTWVFGVEAQGNWADFRGSNTSLIHRGACTNRSQDRRVRPVHRPGRLRLEQRPALRQGRRRGGRRPAINTYRHRRPACSIDSSASDTRWGGTVGAGLEYGFAPNWSAGGRIRPHVHGHGTTSTSRLRPACSRATDRIRQDVDMVTVRVNYRWGGPVIAKY